MNQSIFDGARVLITGGTGSWGQTLTKLLLENYNVKEIVSFSRGELQQVLMQRKFNNPKIKFIIGDVRDYQSVLFATKSIDIIFHLAALKHVPICEEHPQEAIKTNVIGTTNVVNAAIANGVKKVIDVSTDKAVEPLNLYGMTKAVGEKIIIQANHLTNDTKFICVRGGNVMGSNGSVIPFFIETIKNQKPIQLTDRRMTRFFLTLEEAIGLLFKAADASLGGETFVMNMPAARIIDIAEVLMSYYGQVNIVEIGKKPGEKLDEVLISSHESSQSVYFDDTYYIILPENLDIETKNYYQNHKRLDFDEFSSKTKLLNKEEISTMLKKGNFI